MAKPTRYYFEVIQPELDGHVAIFGDVLQKVHDFLLQPEFFGPQSTDFIFFCTVYLVGRCDVLLPDLIGPYVHQSVMIHL